MRLGRSKGYRIVGCNFSGANAFFVRDDIAGNHFLDPATAEEHYEPPRYFFPMLKGGHSARPRAVRRRLRRYQRSSHFGSRFSMKAEIPSSASRASMFSTITSVV